MVSIWHCNIVVIIVVYGILIVLMGFHVDAMMDRIIIIIIIADVVVRWNVPSYGLIKVVR